jgi:hypothetical protein
MFTNYLQVSRFMDGIGVNITDDFGYLKDINGYERIGKYSIDRASKDEGPKLIINDLISKKSLAYEGDSFKIDKDSRWDFEYFPSVKHLGLLEECNLIKSDRMADRERDCMLTLISGEMMLHVADNGRYPIGSQAQKSFHESFTPYFGNDVARKYLWTLERMYGRILKNTDIMLYTGDMCNKDPCTCALQGLRSANGETLDITDMKTNLIDFLEANPHLESCMSRLGDRHRKNVDTTPLGKAIEDLKEIVPLGFIDAGFQQFREEYQGKKRLGEIRIQYPVDEVKEALKNVDDHSPFVISRNNAANSIEIFEKIIKKIT